MLFSRAQNETIAYSFLKPILQRTKTRCNSLQNPFPCQVKFPYFTWPSTRAVNPPNTLPDFTEQILMLSLRQSRLAQWTTSNIFAQHNDSFKGIYLQ